MREIFENHKKSIDILKYHTLSFFLGYSRGIRTSGVLVFASKGIRRWSIRRRGLEYPLKTKSDSFFLGYMRGIRTSSVLIFATYSSRGGYSISSISVLE
jgi:hypothetical protein